MLLQSMVHGYRSLMFGILGLVPSLGILSDNRFPSQNNERNLEFERTQLRVSYVEQANT